MCRVSPSTIYAAIFYHVLCGLCMSTAAAAAAASASPAGNGDVSNSTDGSGSGEDTSVTRGALHTVTVRVVTSGVGDVAATTTGSEGAVTKADDATTDTFLSLFKETWFIGVCAGLGAFFPMAAFAMCCANYKRRKQLAKRKHHQVRNKEVEGNRRSAVLHELMGYDPMPGGPELTEKDLSVWVASNDQLRLPHIMVNGVSSAPFTSHARITKQSSEISMSAKLFVKDWGEDFPPDATLSGDHSNIVLNPVFEEHVLKGSALQQIGPGRDGPGQDGPGRDGPGQDGPGRDGPEQDGPDRRLQRRTSQLGLMRQALAPTDDEVDWVSDETFN